MATFGAAPEEGGLQGLLAASPDRAVHTSAAAEIAFVLGLVAVAAAPFSVMLGLSLTTGAIGLVFGVVGMARTSRPDMAGQALVPLGMLFAIVALVLVGLRYLGVDTAFGDDLLPTLQVWMESLNSRVPGP